MSRDRDEVQRSGVSPRLLAALVLLALLIVFVVQNTGRTKIRFLIPEVTTRLWIALMVAVVVGIMIGWLLSRARHDRDRG